MNPCNCHAPGGYPHEPDCDTWNTVDLQARDRRSQHLQHLGTTMDAETLLNTFELWWARKMRKGEVNALSTLERSSIGMLVRWLCRHYVITEKT